MSISDIAKQVASEWIVHTITLVIGIWIGSSVTIIYTGDLISELRGRNSQAEKAIEVVTREAVSIPLQDEPPATAKEVRDIVKEEVRKVKNEAH